MLHKLKVDRKNIVLFVYVVILCLLGPLIIVINQNSNKLTEQFKQQNDKPKQSLATRMSSGDRLLITADINPVKQSAVQAYASQDYQTAVEQFQASLKINSNDPEALIYWNNSLAKLQGETVKLATSVPIGGNLDVAKEILRGVAQAQTQINRNGGINGKLVEVTIANDDNVPEIAKQIATELVKDESILAVIGHNDSNASVAAAPIYQAGELVMITPTSSAENLPNLGSYIFRATPNTRALAEPLAEYASDIARKKDIAVCADSQSEVSQSFQKEFTWAIYSRGGSINPIECDFSAANFNPSQIPSEAISAGADALLLAPSVRSVNRAIEVARANQERLTLLGNHSLNTYQTLQEGQKEVNSMVLSVAWDAKSNTNNAFALDAQKLWGGAVNWRTAMAYDATQIAVAAIKPGNTRQQVQMVLSDPQFVTEGATELIQFLPSGDRNMKGTLVKVEPGTRSGTGYDFVLLQPPTQALK
ncbi:ABC transporter substrate-binding protein [Myxosarcina sp. GI1]|uniref:ABC transporter substrate-binding protein n=1 Tax=Myxosarcina sp. GI1 TaxID=1541065 RepID=UPI000564B8FD|nr:ABC transporter substrate-binding protein [Myxosarcina sp. GI1]